MSRGKIRSYSRMVRERGRMFLSHVMNFYTEDRWITYRNQDGNQAMKQIKGSEMISPAKLTVVSGSTMPVSHVQRREEALTLFTSGAIDQPELLERLDWPNRTEVVKRMQAGPVGEVIQKLEATGMPPELMQYVQGVAGAEMKDIQKGIESGEMPSFIDLLKQVMSQGQQRVDQAQEAEMTAKQVEFQKISAEIEKLIAEKELTVERSISEKVDQQVKLAGIGFDKEKMSIERAALVSKIDAEVVASMQGNKPGYNERGIKSNNMEE
jgi:hypothetical protein